MTAPHKRSQANEIHNGYRVDSDWPQPTQGSSGTLAGKMNQIPTLTLEMPSGMAKSGLAKYTAAIEAVLLKATQQQSR